MAALSWDMGCRLVGKLSSMVTTWEGSAARLAHSRDTQFTCGEMGLSLRAGGAASPPPPSPGPQHVTCSWVGTSPVTSSQKRPSGSGSSPPAALGSSFWHSGMLYPRKRMP